MKSLVITKSNLIVFFSINLLIGFFYISVGFIDNFAILFTNYLILFISTIGLLYKINQYYSLSKIFYSFSFFFFGIVPYLDYSTNNYYWGGDPIYDYYFIIANIIIIEGLICYFFGYFISKTRQVNQVYLENEKLYLTSIRKNIFKVSVFLLLISLIASFFILLKNNFNILIMMFRGSIEKSLYGKQMSQIEFLVFNYFITPIPVSVLLIYGYISYGEKKRYQKLFIIFLFALVFFFVAPTSVARFLAITLYLSIVLRFTRILERRYIFQIGSIFGLMILMPFLDKFRRFDVKTFNFSIDFTYLSQGTFDAYQNFVRILSINYISYGKQLLGALFFFIPRSIFAEKPIGSGSLVASLGNLKFDNISMPLIGEGYINFSVIGSLIFMMFFGLVSGKLDKYYWSLKNYINNHRFFNVYYLLLGMSFFILRGDLMSSFAYTVSLVGTYIALMYFVHKVCILKIR